MNRKDKSHLLTPLQETQAVLLSPRQIFERLKHINSDNEQTELDPFVSETPEIKYCQTCGSIDEKCHPDKTHCYHCRTDNWASPDKIKQSMPQKGYWRRVHAIKKQFSDAAINPFMELPSEDESYWLSEE